MANDRRLPDVLATLQTVLASAADLANDLTTDPLAARLLTALARMPVDDRETIVSVIEREVEIRQMSLDGSGALSGHRITKANPNARLYLRVEDGEGPSRVVPDEILRALIRTSRVLHRLFQHDGHAKVQDVWRPVIVRGMRALSVEELESLRWYHRKILEFADEADRPTH